MNEWLDQWEAAAERFAACQEQSEFAEVNKAVVKRRFPAFHGERVLDLGCGYGYYTRYFDSVGARTMGVDGAEAMIRIARERYPDGDFSVAGLSGPLPFDGASFDLVFCNQVLMDIEDIGPVLRECRRVLKDGGLFYYSIVHPAFFSGSWLTDGRGCRYAKAVSRYLTPYVCQNHFWGETAHFHRPLSAYLNAAADAGFALLRTEEPRSYDGVHKSADLPLFFFSDYEKRRGPAAP